MALEKNVYLFVAVIVIIFHTKNALQQKAFQDYRDKKGCVWNGDSGDDGHVGQVDEGGVEADHREGVRDPDQEEEGVRQQLEVHHLLQNGEHSAV